MIYKTNIPTGPDRYTQFYIDIGHDGPPTLDDLRKALQSLPTSEMTVEALAALENFQPTELVCNPPSIFIGEISGRIVFATPIQVLKV